MLPPPVLDELPLDGGFAGGVPPAGMVILLIEVLIRALSMLR